MPDRAATMKRFSWSGPMRWLACFWHPSQLRARRQLRLCESLALGEKRFVSVVEFADQKFLVGGTGTSLALLAVLSDKARQKENRADENTSVWQFVNGELTRKSGCA